MITVLLATSSAHKLAELAELTHGEPFAWRSLAEFDLAAPDETGETFAANARLKALYYAERTGLPTLADDSGIAVDALDGAPGVHSAYFAGLPRDDAANNRKLVECLRDIPPQRRTARYHCALALADRGRVVAESHGTFEGRIVDTPRGTHGFGYDPYFLVPELDRTAAELSPHEKNAISHRGRALRDMLERLARYFAVLR